MLFESVPNFSEGRRQDVVAAIAAAAGRAHLLDTDPDPDHNRVVVSIAGGRRRLVDGFWARSARRWNGSTFASIKACTRALARPTWYR